MAENETISDDSANYNGGLAAKALNLAEALKKSHEYQEYIAAYNNMNHEEIEKLRSFKQTEALTPPHGRMSFEDEKRISNLYTVLILNQNIKIFIEKERLVCAIMANILNIIGDIHLFLFE